MLGLALAIGAAVSQIDWCFGERGCEDDPFDRTALFVLVLGFVALAGAPVLAARMSGRPAWFGWGVLGAAGFLAALVVGGVVFGILFDNVAPGLVAALAAEGVIAVKPPVPYARVVRAVVVGVLVALAAAFAVVGEYFGLALLALLALPAIGLADTIALRSVSAGGTAQASKRTG